jgi:hypothetical protein
VRMGLAGMLVTGVLLVVGSAGEPGASGGHSGTSAPGGGTMGPGISVEEALASKLREPLLVNGWLRQDDRGITLCTSLTEATPPRCMEPSLVVRGLRLNRVQGLRTEHGVTWSTRPTQVLGELRDGVLTVFGLSTGSLRPQH